MHNSFRATPYSCAAAMMFFLFTFFPATVLADASDYAGVYAGSYGGDDSGYIGLVIEISGEAHGISVSDFGFGGILSSVSFVGNDFSAVYSSGGIVTGTVDGDVIRGAWQNDGLSGDLFLERIVATSQLSEYAGSYGGEFSGDDAGEFLLLVDNDGYCLGLGASRITELGFATEGLVDVDGSFQIEGATTSNAQLTGRMNDGQVSGSWINLSTGQTGTFAGSKLNAPIAADSDDTGGQDDGGGGGGGGCTATNATPGHELLLLLAAACVFGLLRRARGKSEA